MKRFFLILSICLVPILSHADLLSDLISGKYNSSNISEMVSMPDGQTYAQLSNGLICTYSYQTGEVNDTLFNISATKLMKLDTIEGFLLSKSGRWMLVYNNARKIYRRSFEASYYIFDCERNELKPLTSDMPVRDPKFSPNSRYIAFSKQNNLYIHKLDFGTEVAVTTDGEQNKIINGTSDWLYEEEFTTTALYEWGADSKQLAFVRLDETDVPQFTYQTMLNQGYPESNTFKYPRAGEANAIAKVVVYDTYYKSLKTMKLDIPENSYIPRLIWTNNPDQFAIFTLNRNQNKLEMYLANPKSTVCKLCYFEENKNGYVDYSAIDEFQFLSDNSFMLVSEQDGYRHAYLYSSTGLKQKQLTQGRYDVTYVYGYDEQTQTLYYQAAQQLPSERQIYACKKGKTYCIASETGMHNAKFSATYQYFIDSYSSVSQPLQVVVRNASGKQVRVLKDNHEVEQSFSSLNLPEKQFTTMTTERGDTLYGWILYPVNFDKSKQYPVVQIQYSGPASQQVLNRWRKDWEYDLSARGYLVACFDGRGTDARGREFRQQTYMNLGVKEAQDQVAVAQFLGSLPYVDAERIAIWGWSYGGFMTLMSMSQPEHVFKAGIAIAPVTDFRLYDSGYTERFMRRPQENYDGYVQCSLPNMADQLNGRLLIVHGMADDNVHVQNTFKYVEALTKANKQFEMQIYPDDNHFLKKGNHYQHVYNRMIDFLSRNL